MAFAIKSNCLAHSKSRHNRTVKPIFFDIIKNEHIVEEAPSHSGELEDDSNPTEEKEEISSHQRKVFLVFEFNHHYNSVSK